MSLDIAVVAAAGRFPGAPDVEALWRAVLERRSAAKPVQPGRWPVEATAVLSPAPAPPDKAQSAVSCPLDPFALSAEEAGLPAELLSRLDEGHRLALRVGVDLLRGSTARFDRARTGVVLANIVLPTEASSRLAQALLFGALEERVLGRAETPKLEPLDARACALPAELLCQALGLGGGGYTLDAACASSLYALRLACLELREGRLDAAVAGGLSKPQSIYTQVGFSQLQALSPSGVCSPFDGRADGLVVGEGAGLFLLKRLEDAQAAGDPILGVIRAIGLSNDVGGSLLLPESEGQLRAMRAAYAQAGWAPSDVDLVECHGTGTRAGDAVELKSLAALRGEGGPACALGSVKANVGHLLTAAGAAGLTKVLMALRTRTLPPATHLSAETASAPLRSGSLRVLEAPTPWPERTPGQPRRAAVSGFGFGGINAHLLIEEASPMGPPPLPLAGEGRGEGVGGRAQDLTSVRSSLTRSEPIALVGVGVHLGALRGKEAFQQALLRGEPALRERPAKRWGLLEGSRLLAQLGAEGAWAGNWLESLELEPGRFKIPPREIPSVLPQQLVMLDAAAQALADARGKALPEGTRPRAGAVVGLGLDLESTTFHLRWLLRDRARGWAAKLGLPGEGPEFERWLAGLADSLGPALDAQQTLGALGGIVASRVAREFQLGGPCFTVSGEEASGLRALEVAARLLQSGEADVMLAGAVDLAGDARAALASLRPWAREASHPLDRAASGSALGEGACAVVLKRLSDAERDGDRIYATLRGFGAASAPAFAPSGAAWARSAQRALDEAGVSPEGVGLVETHGSGQPDEDAAEAEGLARALGSAPSVALTASKAVAGHTGAASGLAGAIHAALCLHQEVLPPLAGLTSARDGLAAPFHAPRAAQAWLRERASGPRRALVAALSPAGCAHALLEGVEQPAQAHAVERARPLGERGAALFLLAEGEEAALRALAERQPRAPLEALAAQWHQARKQAPVRRALVAQGRAELLESLARPAPEPHGGASQPTRVEGELAFVFPGSGNHHVGMGRSLSAALPQVYRALDAEVGHLAGHLMPGLVLPQRLDWSAGWEADAARALAARPEVMILSQVAHGVAVSDALRLFGLKPKAWMGYSLGESAALFASRAWRDRDVMFRRTLTSPLFRTQLAGPCEVARAAWGGQSDWHAVIVNRPAAEVRRALQGTAALLIVDAPSECVLGGRRPDVERTVAALGCEAIALEGVPTVHCALVQPVAEAYRALHLLPATPPEGARFYSGAWARPYEVTTEAAADSILANALHGFDFSALIERAYADGVRIFVEPGPQGSCARMIGRILAGRPHLAIAADQKGQDGFLTLLRALGRLAEAGVAIDLAPLYDVAPPPAPPRTGRGVVVELGARGKPLPPAPRATLPAPAPVLPAPMAPTPIAPTPQIAPLPHGGGAGGEAPSVLRAAQATAQAHEAFLRAAQNAVEIQTRALLEQQRLIALLSGEDGGPSTSLRYARAERELEADSISAHPERSAEGAESKGPEAEPVALDRQACMEFAIGSIGKALGPAWAAADANPTRVRLPDEPLMLCDRIVRIEGEPNSLTTGRCITEHDVLPGAWYLDGGRAPVCISVEAGQADLFLSAYLGIDHQTKGERVYRLLDAKVVFHRDLPRPGETIRYDIRIDRFIRQGDTWLFFFRFDGTIDGQPLITMYDGCAGFFSDEQLNTGRGIVQERAPAPEPKRAGTEPFAPLVPFERAACSEAQVEALRAGDAGAAFGGPFAGLTLPEALRLPSGRMHLVDRILELDPKGGRHGLGTVLGEADITPDAWFLTCHFKDDPVMPGTLMYECCLHTLRVLLLRMGWAVDAASAPADLHHAPVEGIASRLKCRGQVLPSTQKVQYRIDLKEVGYDPEPYVLADASMYADGKHIVEMESMSVRLRGLSRAQVEQTWAARPHPLPLAGEGRGEGPKGDAFTQEQILAYCVGAPSACFGEKYRPFDNERRLARLPGPPFLFIDRVTSAGPQPFVLKPGGWAECEYAVPRDAWYFAADRAGHVPFSVLLEAALQPCGFLAAYLGSALLSEQDLHFRNLDGQATQFIEVGPETGLLTTRAKLTKTSTAGGMILQEFEMEVLRGQERVYAGSTGFGFFPGQALAQQVGLRGRSLWELPGSAALALPRTAPRTPEEAMRTARPASGMELPSQAYAMIDEVQALSLSGGPHGLGYVQGTKRVDPGEWFFAAHFFQDPVQPGSLGLEAMLQLMKVYARERFGRLSATHRFRSMALGRQHKWSYRGQVIPSNKLVTVQAAIKRVEEGPRPVVVADGLLSVDGKVIYAMHDFVLELVPKEER